MLKIFSTLATEVVTTIPTTNPNLTNPIRCVTPEEFIIKFEKGADMILQVLGGMVLPIVSICFVLSIITYVMGGILHSDQIRKTGAAGIGASILGYFVYLLSPYIMGLLYSIAQIFK